MNSNNLSNMFQLAYKLLHSSDTARQNAHTDITLNIDNGKVTAFTMLRLSSAFATINHRFSRGSFVFVIWCIWCSFKLA